LLCHSLVRSEHWAATPNPQTRINISIFFYKGVAPTEQFF